MKKKIFATLLVFGFAITNLIGCSNTANNIADIETTKKNNIDEIYTSDIYEFIDPDTGVHYLIYSHKTAGGGMGGMTPRLNSDGTIMIAEEN